LNASLKVLSKTKFPFLNFNDANAQLFLKGLGHLEAVPMTQGLRWPRPERKCVRNEPANDFVRQEDPLHLEVSHVIAAFVFDNLKKTLNLEVSAVSRNRISHIRHLWKKINI